MKTYITLLLFYVVQTVEAQVITDGSLGQALDLSGPDYQITQALGTTVGNNLFHSFTQLNLTSNESATFSGSNHIQNVISRVTGGSASHINGTLRATIPDANLYLLNPDGIVFGEHAQLDVQGSFHASTADALTFADGTEFHAHLAESTLLSVAPVASFGFLSETPAPIQVQDSQLSVPAGQVLSLIGGDLNLHNQQQPYYDASSTAYFNTQLSAAGGRIQLVSLASAGQVLSTLEGVAISDNATLGNIQFKNFAVSASGIGGGDIFIRAGQLLFEHSQISSHTLGPIDGGVIDIQAVDLRLLDSDILAYTLAAGKGADMRLQVTGALHAAQQSRPIGELITSDGRSRANGSSRIATLTGSLNGELASGDSGNIEITAGKISLYEGAGFATSSSSLGNSGDIVVTTEVLQADGGQAINSEAGALASGILSFSGRQSKSGNVKVSAQHVQLTNGALINTSTINAVGGDVEIQADTLRLAGQFSGNGAAFPAGIVSLAFRPGSQAGTIRVAVNHLSIQDGGMINTGTYYGEGGQIFVNVAERLWVSGVGKLPVQTLGFPELPFPSLIGSNSATPAANAGDGGDLSITAKHIVLENGGALGNFSYGGGDVGDLSINAQTLTISGQYIRDDGSVHPSGILDDSFNPLPYAGDAGDVQIQADKITVAAGGVITTAAKNAGGGNIAITTHDLLYVDEGVITTSVQNGSDSGGNIEINSGRLSVLKQGTIIARAHSGHGGNIKLNAHYPLYTPNSLIDASSRSGMDGEISLSSPTQDLTSGLVALPEVFLAADALLPKPCVSQAHSSFTVMQQDGIGHSPGDLWGNGVPFERSTHAVRYAAAGQLQRADIGYGAHLKHECGRDKPID